VTLRGILLRWPVHPTIDQRPSPMNIPAPLFLCALFTAVFTSSQVRAQTGPNAIRMEVRVLSEQDRKDLKGTQVDAVTQKKTLAIVATGAAKNPETRKGKWMVFGRNLTNENVVLIDSGEFKIDLSDHGVQRFESKEVSTESAREHATAARKGANAQRGKIKKVGATGTKYIGYGVQIRDGANIVAEVFDPPSLKQNSP